MNDDDEELAAYDEGVDAGERRMHADDCPYPFHTPKGVAWLDGFEQAGGYD